VKIKLCEAPGCYAEATRPNPMIITIGSTLDRLNPQPLRLCLHHYELVITQLESGTRFRYINKTEIAS
jgi:hypothetical protein